MEIHQLRYFCAVAERGSFTLAAQKVRATQPTLSQQISKLEKELGTNLFDRLGRAVHLTEAGKTLLPFAKSILNQVAEATSKIRGEGLDTKGEVTVGALPTIAPHVLPQLLISFRRKHPACQFRIVENMQESLLEALNDSALDFAFLQLPVHGDFDCLEVAREPLFLAVPANHHLAKRKTIKLREIKEDPFIMLREGFAFRQTAVQLLERAHIRPRNYLHASSFRTMVAMVSAGIGVSILPGMAVERRRGCKFIRLHTRGARRVIGLVRLRRHSLSLMARLFWEHVKGNPLK